MTRASIALGLFAAVFLLAFTGVLIKLRSDARGSLPVASGPGAQAVTLAWRNQLSGVGKLARGAIRDVGCEAVAGTKRFTCQIFLTADGKNGFRETVPLRPISYCTGTKQCLAVGSWYYTIGKSTETKVSSSSP